MSGLINPIIPTKQDACIKTGVLPGVCAVPHEDERNNRPGISVPIVSQNRQVVSSFVTIEIRDTEIWGTNFLGKEYLLGAYSSGGTAETIVNEIALSWEVGGVYFMPGKTPDKPDAYISEDVPSTRPVQLLNSMRQENPHSGKE